MLRDVVATRDENIWAMAEENKYINESASISPSSHFIVS